MFIELFSSIEHLLELKYLTSKCHPSSKCQNNHNLNLSTLFLKSKTIPISFLKRFKILPSSFIEIIILIRLKLEKKKVTVLEILSRIFVIQRLTSYRGPSMRFNKGQPGGSLTEANSIDV